MKQRGSVFILALIVLTACTAILALTVSAQRVSFKSTVNRMESKRAKYMAEAGVQRAITELTLLTSPGLVNQTQEWYLLGTNGDDKFTVSGDSFRLQVVDAASLINLNTATEDQLLNLGLTQAQIDSLLDWREPGETPRTEGAKNDYYNGLENPYNARLGRLQSLDEVLLIKDWLPSSLYDVPTSTTNTTISVPRPLCVCATVDSYSPNTNPTGGALQNINTAQAQQLVQAGIAAQTATAIIARRNGLGQFTSMNQVFSTPGLDQRSAGVLLDGFSTSAAPRLEGKLNLNTVTEDVLESVPGITTDIAQSIVSTQATGFANLSEILQINGVTVQLLSQIADRFSVGSDTFVIRCQGHAGQADFAIEAVVQMVNGAPVVLKTLETSQTDMTTLWQWSTDTSNEIVLGEDSR